MHAGIDPFNDDDPMGIYKNILRGKISFPSTFDKDAKSLVKHLLVADLSKRFGNLKDGKNLSIQVSMTLRSIGGSTASAGTTSLRKKSRLPISLLSRVLEMYPISKSILTLELHQQWR
jgi:hypothetical protein